MPKTINSPAIQQTQNTYGAMDLVDVHNLSQHNFESLYVLINTARNKMLDSINALQKSGFPALNEDYFKGTLKLLEIAEDISENCGNDAEKEAQKYEVELQLNNVEVAA